MEPQETTAKHISYVVFHATILVLTLMLANSSTCTARMMGNESDQLALLEFKSSIVNDPYRILGSWNESVPYCQWRGVTCGRKHQRVTTLDLSGQSLSGTISPHIGNLSFLRYMNLSSNILYGHIPQDIGSLSQLRQLNLTNNTLGGALPSNLSHCKDLNVLLVADNKLIGKIPVGLGSLKNLVQLGLYKNNLTGELPQSLGNLSSLEKFSVAANNLRGSIPSELGELRSMSFLAVGANNLSGVIPPSVYNISSMNMFSATSNQLTGTIPIDIGSTLPNLIIFQLYGNQFTGTIPASIANASQLQFLTIGDNKFSGQVPKEIGLLLSLQYLSVELNQLGGNPIQDLSFLVPLSNCTYLTKLFFGYNNLGGRLADFGANFSIQLTSITMGSNQIWGPIPGALSSLTNLYFLSMEDNILSGSIPSSFGKLEHLQRLNLNNNKLTGQIPFSLGNISRLSQLGLSNNRFNGTIPESLGKCKLEYLDISQNYLYGPIPPHIIVIPSLSMILNLSENMLSGPLPAEIGKLISLNTLDITDNYLSGEIPASIGDCLSLEYLYMGGNSFVGTIPSTLSSLKGIIYLNLSHNKLTGKIPTQLGSLSYLQYLNLSFNELEGEIPTNGVFANTTIIVSVAGNSKLCGGIPELHQPLCPHPVKRKQKFPTVFKLITSLVCVGFFFIGATFFGVLYWRKKTRKVSIDSSGKNKLLRISYRELYRATNGFSSEKIIGSGSFGTVYKGNLNNQPDQLIAVKVLNLQYSRAFKSFVAECKVLRNIRHRNLVKILTYCSSIDSRHNDFKALVYEFMPNGNLDMLLHPDEANSLRTLSLLQRLNIAIDIASALQYLHSECEVPIIHCDLKPSNILLDDEMCAHVGDFGLARFRPKITEDAEISSIGLKGSIGYAAPEYGTGSDVSAFGDVYSYGIILLEMMTGRRPTDEIFREGLNLHNYVKMALPNQVRLILDPVLDIEQQLEAFREEGVLDGRSDEIQEMEQHGGNIGTSNPGELETEKCIFSIITIALACSEESPTRRMDMNGVTTKLHHVRDVILGH